MVLSAQFWPAFREEKIKLPEVMQKSLEEYTKKFEALKGNRTLNWKPHLGITEGQTVFTLVCLRLWIEIFALYLFCICYVLWFVGLVNIDVELKDRTLNFNVSPVHAAIIIQFQSQGTVQYSFIILDIWNKHVMFWW